MIFASTYIMIEIKIWAYHFKKNSKSFFKKILQIPNHLWIISEAVLNESSILIKKTLRLSLSPKISIVNFNQIWY